jgi:hypothetical protein
MALPLRAVQRLPSQRLDVVTGLEPEDAEDGAHGWFLRILDSQTKKTRTSQYGLRGLCVCRALTAGPSGSIIQAIVVGAQRGHGSILHQPPPADKRRFRL